MSIQTLIFIIFGGIAIWMLANPLTKKINQPKQEPISPTEEEPNRIDDPVEADPEPTQIPVIPIEDEGEMPIKPLPKDCQKATFRPAPEKFYYTDCCGKYHEGEGYQAWEKRSPVAIDCLKPSIGMDFLGEEAEIDC